MNTQAKTKKEERNAIPAQGLITDTRVYLSQDGETLIHRAGNLRIELHVNLYKKVLGIPFEPKKAEDAAGPIATYRVYGANIRDVRLSLSKDGQYLFHWVLGVRISKHVNFYKKVLGAEFTPVAANRSPQVA